MIRCDQRILLNWKEVRQTAEDGHYSVEPKIRTCFIANAIPMDGRDVIYPVHFTDMPVAKMFSITPAVKHLMIRGRDNSLLYLADNEVLHVKSMGHYTEIYCVNNIYESSEGILCDTGEIPGCLPAHPQESSDQSGVCAVGQKV